MTVAPRLWLWPLGDARGDHAPRWNRPTLGPVQSGMSFDRPFRGSTAIKAGLLTRGELRGPGFHHLFDDIYVSAALPVDLALRSRGAYLRVADAGGVLSGYSAAEILGASCGPADAPAEVTVPGGHLLRQPGLRVHRGLLDPEDVTTVDGLGVTTRTRAGYDLARFAPSLVEAVVAVDALAACDPHAPGGAFAPTDVLRLRNRHLGARGSRRLPEVVALADPLAQSPMETRTRLALVLHGLPPPVAQFELRGAGHCHYLDLAYPRYRVAVEYDGGGHRTPEQARRDLERQHRLSRLDWTVVRPRSDRVAPPRLVAVSVYRELERAAERLGLPMIAVSVALLQ